MNSGNAASDHDALEPQTVVASTEPAGIAEPANCIPAQPVASSAIAIHTPPASRTIRKPNRIAAAVSSSKLHPALDRALDHFFGGLRLRQFVARRIAAHTWISSSTKAMNRMTRPPL